MTKWKSNFEINKELECRNRYYGKNWNVITMYLIIITVIVEIIVKIEVMLRNNYHK